MQKALLFASNRSSLIAISSRARAMDSRMMEIDALSAKVPLDKANKVELAQRNRLMREKQTIGLH